MGNDLPASLQPRIGCTAQDIVRKLNDWFTHPVVEIDKKMALLAEKR